MSPAPLIGITGKRGYGKDLKGSFQVMGHLHVDVYWVDYAQGVISAGGVPVFLPLDVNPDLYINRLDGILMSGGADIHPNLYGEEPAPETYKPEPLRDEFETALLDAVCEYELPVAGICRGLQMINVYFGGSLIQDVPEHAVRDKPPNSEVHTVILDEASTLGGLYGPSREVNSLHHQSIDRLGKDLAATATSQDGGIEGIEHESLPLVAVQWHPEMMNTRDNDPLFKWLIHQASG